MVLCVDAIAEKLEANNIFLIAKRSVEQQDMLYMSLKFINNIWTLAELKVANGTVQVCLCMMYYYNELSSSSSAGHEGYCARCYHISTTSIPRRLVQLMCLNPNRRQ